LFQSAFPTGLSDAQVAEIAEDSDEKTPFSQERFTAEILELGESAYFEQNEELVKMALLQLEFMGAKKGTKLKWKDLKKRESALAPGFDLPHVEQVSSDWRSWIEFFNASSAVAIETSMDSHMQESIRKIAEEEERDKKVFDEMK